MFAAEEPRLLASFYFKKAHVVTYFSFMISIEMPNGESSKNTQKLQSWYFRGLDANRENMVTVEKCQYTVYWLLCNTHYTFLKYRSGMKTVKSRNQYKTSTSNLL